MQLNLSSFGSVLANPFVFNGYLSEGTESSGVPFLVPFLLFQGGAMDLSKVSEKILSAIRCARSLGLLPSASDRPEVPSQDAAAAAVAYAIAGLPPHQRHHGQKVEEIEEEFYEELLLYNYVMTSTVSTSWTWGCESSNPIDATSRRGAATSLKLSNFADSLIDWHVVFQAFATTLGYNLNQQDAKQRGNHHPALHPKKMLFNRI
ncbi:hypothetical protein ACFX2I_001645 [Malus domestica]